MTGLLPFLPPVAVVTVLWARLVSWLLQEVSDGPYRPTGDEPLRDVSDASKHGRDFERAGPTRHLET